MIVQQNWNGYVRETANGVRRLSNEAQVVAVVQEARRTGRRIKAVGAGHSFNDIGMTNDILVDLSMMDRVLEVDPVRGRVRVQGAVPLSKLVRVLERSRLALANVGAWMAQTVAGVVSTATHGTSGRHRLTLIDSVKKIRLVDGNGRVRELERSNGDLDMITLGLFGIITEVMLDCVPLYYVRRREQLLPFTRAVSELFDRLESHDFVDLRWMGSLDVAKLSTWDKTVSPPGRRERLRADMSALRRHGLMRVIDAVNESRLPSAARARFTMALAERYSRGVASGPVTQVWYRGLTFDSFGFVPRHDEQEYAIPREQTVACLHALQEVLRREPSVSAGIEIQVRFSPASRTVLAPHFGRETTWVNINQFNRSDTASLVESAARVVIAHGARPHWCKRFPTSDRWWLDRHEPHHYADWEATRRALDPEGIFSNRWYESYLADADRVSYAADALPRRRTDRRDRAPVRLLG